MLHDKIKIQLSKAVLLRDALTGEPVSSGIQIHAPSGVRMEKKSTGHILFLNVETPEFEIEVKSPVYQTRKLRLQADGGEALDDIPMYPSPAYPWRAGYTAVKGKAEPGSTLWFHFEDERSVCRLVKGYKKGEGQISFYIKNKMAGALWHIRKKKETQGAYFALKNIVELSEGYCLREPLERDYPIKDTVIYPAQETIADENGAFYMLLSDLPQEKCVLYYTSEKAGEMVQKEIELVREKENFILEEG